MTGQWPKEPQGLNNIWILATIVKLLEDSAELENNMREEGRFLTGCTSDQI